MEFEIRSVGISGSINPQGEMLIDVQGIGLLSEDAALNLARALINAVCTGRQQTEYRGSSFAAVEDTPATRVVLNDFAPVASHLTDQGLDLQAEGLTLLDYWDLSNPPKQGYKKAPLGEGVMVARPGVFPGGPGYPDIHISHMAFYYGGKPVLLVAQTERAIADRQAIVNGAINFLMQENKPAGGGNE